MGAGKKRRAKFLADNPNCYFCGSVATTIDHVPSRECFIDRQWPEGYEFPACEHCNKAAAGAEQAVAMYRHGADFTLDPRSQPQLFKLYAGVRNNRPDLLPELIDTRQKRKAAKSFGIQPVDGETYANLPIVKLPDGIREAFDLFAKRLTCALFYKHLGKPMPMTNMMLTFRQVYRGQNVERILSEFMKYAEHGTKTMRQNTDIGEQFVYIWGHKPAEDFLMFVAQFAKAFFIVGISSPPSAETTGANWKLHSDDIQTWGMAPGS